MKLSAFLAGWMFILSCASASMSEAVKVERPAVSLEQAVQITKAMLHSQDDDEKYYIFQAELFGGDRTEVAQWSILLADSVGNRAMVSIMTKTPECSLHYQPRDSTVSGTKVQFNRDGVSVRVKNEK